jgi:hypothetical protein
MHETLPSQRGHVTVTLKGAIRARPLKQVNPSRIGLATSPNVISLHLQLSCRAPGRADAGISREVTPSFPAHGLRMPSILPLFPGESSC